MQSVAGQIYRRYGAVLHLGLLEVCEADDKLPLLSICLGHSLGTLVVLWLLLWSYP